MADLYEYSTPELVRLLGSRFREYRMCCNLTQREVAVKSGAATDDALHGTTANDALFVDTDERLWGEADEEVFQPNLIERLAAFEYIKQREVCING